uniref:Creatinase N-terminal domain-containing protein n=1 Tax=Timema shepardi TaxID=629360 RepID=A0A7R9BAR5_TIMSH|nr:unnamed protein product [Timema shepardi]
MQEFRDSWADILQESRLVVQELDMPPIFPEKRNRLHSVPIPDADQQWTVEDRANISLISVGLNPIDLIWTDRPPYAKQPAFVHDLKYAGKEWGEKVLELRQELKALQMDAMVVTSLDEVAWLLNIRGRDTPYSPLVRAFLIVTPSEIHMYTNQSKIPREVRLHLNTWSCHSENCVR